MSWLAAAGARTSRIVRESATELELEHVGGGRLDAAGQEELGRMLAAVRVEAPSEPPARLHGDLWWGNVLAGADGRPWLIDPAAYGGHREMDLAMLALFGPLPERVTAAYDEIAPLTDSCRRPPVPLTAAGTMMDPVRRAVHERPPCPAPRKPF